MQKKKYTNNYEVSLKNYDLIFSENKNQVYKVIIAKSRLFGFSYFEDFLQLTRIALFEAIETYDETRSAFNTWFYIVQSKHIEIYIRTFIKREKSFSNTINDNNESDNENPSQFQIPVFDFDLADLEYRNLRILKFKKLLKASTTPYERRLLYMNIVDELNQQEIANSLNVSRQTISIRIQRAIAKIRESAWLYDLR